MSRAPKKEPLIFIEQPGQFGQPTLTSNRAIDLKNPEDVAAARKAGIPLETLTVIRKSLEPIVTAQKAKKDWQGRIAEFTFITILGLAGVGLVYLNFLFPYRLYVWITEWIWIGTDGILMYVRHRHRKAKSN